MKSKGVLYLVMGLFLVSSVLAIDMFSVAIDPFSQVDFGAFYGNYYMFIDGIIYLLIFLGLTQFVFKKRFDKSAKPIIVGMSLMLSFGSAYFEYQTGFMLGKLAPIAMLIILFVVLFLLYELFKTITEDVPVSISMAILIGYSILRSAFSFLYEWLKQNSPLAIALIHLAAIVAFILLIIRLFRMFSNGGNGQAGSPPVAPNPNQPQQPGQPPNPNPAPPNAPNAGQQVAPIQVSISQPATGQHFGINDPITLSADVSQGTQPYSVEWFINGVNHHGGNSTGRVITTIGLLPPGRYDLTINAHDANNAAAADRREFFVDAPAAPTITINIPKINEHYTEGNTLKPEITFTNFSSEFDFVIILDGNVASPFYAQSKAKSGSITITKDLSSLTARTAPYIMDVIALEQGAANVLAQSPHRPFFIDANTTTNIIAIVHPKDAPTYPLGTSIPVEFNVSGPGFSGAFDYIIKLNGTPWENKLNARGPTIKHANSLPQTKLLSGKNVLEIIANQPGTTTAIANKVKEFTVATGPLTPSLVINSPKAKATFVQGQEIIYDFEVSGMPSYFYVIHSNIDKYIEAQTTTNSKTTLSSKRTSRVKDLKIGKHHLLVYIYPDEASFKANPKKPALADFRNIEVTKPVTPLVSPLTGIAVVITPTAVPQSQLIAVNKFITAPLLLSSIKDNEQYNCSFEVFINQSLPAKSFLRYNFIIFYVDANGKQKPWNSSLIHEWKMDAWGLPKKAQPSNTNPMTIMDIKTGKSHDTEIAANSRNLKLAQLRFFKPTNPITNMTKVYIGLRVGVHAHHNGKTTEVASQAAFYQFTII